MKKIKLLFMLLLTLVLSFAFVQPLNTLASDDSSQNHVEYDVDGDGQINYVALGDSTSNGYGLGDYYLRYQKHYQEGHVCDNYCVLKDGPITTRDQQRGGNNVGYLNNASEAYPSILADKLADSTGLDVNILNMSISGMRPEELRLLLDKSYMGDKYTDYRFFGDTTVDPNAMTYFYWADNLTFNDPYGFAPDYAVALREAVQAEYGVIDQNSEFYVDYPTANAKSDLSTAKLSADYTYAISNADVISIGLGTNNFGTGAETTIYRALEDIFGMTLGSTVDFQYDLRDILTTHPELVDYYVQFKPVLEQLIIDTLGQEIHDKYYDAFIEILQTYTYALFGFMANYMESLDLIRELNPTAKIVLIPAFNLEEGLKFTYNGTLIDFGKIYGELIDIANLWLSAYVTTLENVSYTKVGEVEIILEEIGRGEINANIMSTMTGDLADNFAAGSGYTSSKVMKMIAQAMNALEYGEVKYTGNILTEAGQLQAAQMLAMWLYQHDPANANETYITATLNFYGIASFLRDAIIPAARNESINLDEMIEVLAVHGFNIGAMIQGPNGMDPAKLYDETVQDLLYVFVRMMFAAGAGVHPSANGHATIAQNVFDTMESGFDTEVKIQRALELLKGEIEAIFGELPTIQELKATLEAKLQQLVAQYPELGQYLEKIEYYTAQLQGASKEEVIAYAKQKLAELQAQVEAILVKATSTQYVYDKDSYYLSLGDSQLTGHGLPGYNNYGFDTYVNGSAPYEIAKELFGANATDHYRQLSMGGFRTEDLLWILNPSFQPDEFALDYTANNLLNYGGFNTVEQARQLYVSEIQKADLISLSIGGGNVSTFVGQQIKLYMSDLHEPYAMDWSRYVGAENVKYVEQALQLMKQGLSYAGLPAQMNFLGKNVNTQELLSLVIESFVYGYVGYTVNYTALLQTIKHINPSSQLVVIGYFNLVRGMQYPIELENGSTVTLDFDQYIEYFLELSSAQNLVNAILSNGSVTYVDVDNTVTFLDEAIAANGPVSLMTYLEAIYTNSWYTHASAAGHDYIKNQILNAINASHICNDTDDADCTTAVACDICGQVLVEAKEHAFDNGCDTTCNNDGCNHERVTSHIPGAPADCDNDQLCIECGEVLVTATGHLYGTPSYKWSLENGKYVVTATLTCVHNNQHVISETVSTTYRVITPATCTEDGEGLYTSAQFTDSRFEQQTLPAPIPASHNTDANGLCATCGNVYAYTYAQLYYGVNNGKDTYLMNDLTVTAAYKCPYGNKIALDQRGGTLYGNNHTLTVYGSSNYYAIITYGGTIKDLTIDKACRGIVSYTPTQDVILDNVHIIDDVLYAFNTAEHTTLPDIHFIATNSTFCGWTSVAGGFASVTFDNCTFDHANYGYGWPYDCLVKPYGYTIFKNTTFVGKGAEVGYYLDLSALGTGFDVIFENCYADDELITLANYKEVFGEVEFPANQWVDDYATEGGLRLHNHKYLPGNCTTPMTCEICGETYGDVVHVEETIPAVESTCLETGLTEGVKCSLCGEILVAQQETPKEHRVNENGVCTTCGDVYADTYEELYYGLRNGYDTYLLCDLTVTPAYIAPYGNSVALDQRGGTLYGGNHTLTVEGGSNTYGIITYGGTIKDLIINKARRGIVTYIPTEDVILNNVHVIDEVIYGLNTAELATASGINLYAVDCTFAGWTSISGGFELVTFENCSFVAATNEYSWPTNSLIRPYESTVFKDCTFAGGGNGVGFVLDLSYLGVGLETSLENCYAGTELLTADNYKDLLGEVRFPANSPLGEEATTNGINLHNHKWSTVAGLEPTCTTEGYTDYKVCDLCSAEKDREVIPTRHNVDANGLCVCGNVYADTYEELYYGLRNGYDTYLLTDLTVTAAYRCPYGNQIALDQRGGTLYGNGHTLTVYGSSNYYAIITYGGTIKDLTIDKASRGIVSYMPTEDVILDNVHIINDVLYGFNTAEWTTLPNIKFIATNSTFSGWTSVAGGYESVTFENCTFAHSTYGYGWPYDCLVKPYGYTIFDGCTFVGKGAGAGYYLDLSSLAEGFDVVIEDCYADDELITSANYKSLFGEVEFPNDTVAENASANGITLHNHKWVAASCTAPQTCQVCGETVGVALPHTPTTYTYELLANGSWVKHTVCAECSTTYTEEAPEVVADIAGTVYFTFQDAYAAAVNGDTITLYADVTLSDAAGFAITKEITLDFNAHTVEFTTRKAFRPEADVTFKNGTIINNTAEGRCINLRNTCHVVVENMNLIASASYSTQVITVGVGNGSVVEIIDSTLDAGNSGYAIIAFVPYDLYVENSSLSGFGVLYFKDNDASGSTATLVNTDIYSLNRIFDTTNTNSFSAINIDASDVVVNIDSDSTIKIETTGDQQQTVLGTNANFQPRHYVVKIDATITLVGDNAKLSGPLPCTNELYVLSQYADLLSDQFTIEADGEYVKVTSSYKHVGQVIPGYSETCTTDGLTDGMICTECGEIYVEQEVIPAKHTTDENGVCVHCGDVYAYTYEELYYGLRNGKDTYLMNDLTVTAAYKCPYGNWIALDQRGGTLYGNNHTLTVNGTGNYYAIITYGGTIKDLTIDKACRGIVSYTPTQDVILDNVHIIGDVLYAFNTAEHTTLDDIHFIATNSTFCGWTSVAGGFASVTFDNCTFDHANYGYGWPYDCLIKPYGYTIFKDCLFVGKGAEVGYYLDLSALGTGFDVILENCYADDELITLANYKEVFGEVEFPANQWVDDYATEGGLRLHNHKYTAATCTTPMTCEICGETYGDVVHVEETIPAVEATCTETGLTEGIKCSLCGEILVAQQETPTIPHDYESVVTLPTVYEQGYTTHTCKACGHSYVDSYTDTIPAIVQVGNVQYGRMEDALANWTNGTTLTLLTDITLTDVISLKSNEHHILNLGTYTLTAAEGKNAIEISVNNVGTAAKSCLTINADATNPGGITANKKSCIYYKNSENTADRLMITINGGVFNGSTAISITTTQRGQKCPYIVINGGEFNCNINLYHSMLKVTGGTFHKGINCTGDSTAHRVISGGRFSSMYMTADRADKFTFGTDKGKQDVGLYIDDEGYLVVGGAVITEAGDKFQASTTTLISKWSTYLKLSSAATYGLYYTSAQYAINNNASATITVYDGVVDLTANKFKGKLIVDGYMTVSYLETSAYADSIEFASHSVCKSYTETIDNGIVTRVYRTAEHVNGSPVVENNVDPDCTNPGSYDSVIYCVYCNAELSRQQITVDALGHNYDSVVTDPTCVDEGYTTHTCTRCDDSYVDTIVPALGHNYVSVVTPETCTTDGYTTHTCTRCNHSYEDTIVPAFGHSYTSVVTPATCTTAGYTTYTCSTCNYAYTDNHVTALGHAYVAVVTNPTCTTGGYTTYTCSRCGDSYVSNYTAALGHSYVAVVTHPTCTTAGYTTYTCSTCGDSYVADHVNAKGHTVVVDAAVAATCTTTGLTEGSHCSVCNTVLVAQTIVPSIGHSYSSVVTHPTCTTAGYTTHTCTVCGHSYIDSQVPANGHSYVAVVTRPTCTTAGYTTYTCSVCQHSYVADHVNANGHTIVTDTAVAPTCTTTGLTQGSHCSVCNTVLVAQQVIPAKGHNYSSVVTPATCTTAGYTTHACQTCGHTYVDAHVPAKGHSYNSVVTPATCTTGGYTTHTCTTCGNSYVDSQVPAKGHSYNSVVTPATCTAGGYTTHTCTVCGHYYVDTYTNALGHSAVIDPAVAPTCTETGLTKGSHCAVCGVTIVAQTVVPATGHSTVVLKAVAPTCTETGLTEGSKCSVCNTVLVAQTVVPALGHNYEAVVTAPTCTTEGYTTHTCTTCEHSYVDSQVAALGHTLTHVAATDPTCAQEGVIEHWHCSVCNKNYSDANGNNIVSNVKVPVSTSAHVDADDDNHCDICDKRIAKKSCRKGSVFTFFSFILTTVASCFVLVRRKR